MSLRDVVREARELPLDLIDPPQLDARIARDPEKLDELAHDIAKHGLIFPLAVVRVGERYEVVDGYRRFLACRKAGLVAVFCMIYPTKEAALEGVKFRANAFREDMSPAEEAVFFHELLTHECANDIEQVCAMVSKKLSYVDARLALLQGDEQVFEAVRARAIGVGVAKILNRITAADIRLYYLTFAVKTGATESVVEGWYTEWKNTVDASLPARPASSITPVVVPGPAYDPHRCYICGKNDPRFIPEQVAIHTHCKIAILDELLAGAAPSSRAES